MEEATLCADGWACARSAERVLRAATSLKRHRLRTRYRSALNLGELKSGPDTSSAGRDRIGMGGAGHGTGHVALPSESRQICPSTGSVRTRERGTGPVKKGPVRTHSVTAKRTRPGTFSPQRHQGTKKSDLLGNVCFVCDLRPGRIEVGTGHKHRDGTDFR
jgi:hypothetical protein